MNELAKFIYSAVVERNSEMVRLPLEEQKAVNDLQDLLTSPTDEVSEHIKKGVKPDPWPTFRLDKPVLNP